MALHGVHAAQTSRDGVEVGGIVSAVRSGTKVIDKVARGHDGELVVEYKTHEEDGFVVFLARVTVVAAHVKQVGTVTAQFPQVVHLAHGVGIIKEGVVAVPLVDDSSPACPSPDTEYGGEKVIVGHVRGDFIAVESCYHTDALVVSVAVEQFLAEWEERLGRHIVIFEYDATVSDGECPFLGEIFGGIAPVVPLLIELVDFAFPIDVGNDLTALQDALHVMWSAWSVLIEEEACGTRFLDFVEDFLKEVRTVEEKDEDGYVNVGRMLHWFWK